MNTTPQNWKAARGGERAPLDLSHPGQREPEQPSPAPWTVNTEQDADDWPLIIDDAGRIVANVNTESDIDETKAPAITYRKMPHAANARLIAAAPDLLEACKTALELFRHEFPAEHGSPAIGAAWGHLGRAIETATGEPVEY